MADLKSILGDAYKEDMTVEEITAALEPINLYEGYVEKKVFDKTASEAADWKKKHSALLTEEERKEAERLEADKKRDEELASLKRDKTVADHKARLLGLGYEEALATETAEALADGDTEKVFANQSKFIESRDKAMKAKLLNDTKLPDGGNGGETKTEAEKVVESLVATRTEADKASQSALNYYMGGSKE